MHLDTDFFKFEYNNVLPKEGRILLSEPFLSDSYFERSVVFLTEHNDEGSVGFILNKPLQLPIEEIVEDVPVKNLIVSVGGPVDTDNIHFIHTFEDVPNAIHIKDNLYWGGNFDYIKQLLKKQEHPQHHIRFFLGYSGWSPGQLDSELAQNSWLVTEVSTVEIMNEPDPAYWKKVMRRMGDHYQIWINAPVNPTLN